MPGKASERLLYELKPSRADTRFDKCRDRHHNPGEDWNDEPCFGFWIGRVYVPSHIHINGDDEREGQEERGIDDAPRPRAELRCSKRSWLKEWALKIQSGLREG